MTIATLLRYLIGDRQAILTIASNRHALWIGLLFVLSAGFAREYDGEDLLHEPWHLLIPLAASLVASLILYAMVQYAANSGSIPLCRGSRSGYLSFLGLFWMTAPLAWLYAIPYERFMDAESAIDLNLLTLGVVAAWRVLLMIRVVLICTRLSLWGAVGTVMFFGTSLLIVASFVVNPSILVVMGGLRPYSEESSSQQFLSGLPCLALLPCLVWLILMECNRRAGAGWAVVVDTHASAGFDLKSLAIASLLVWLPILPITQPEQQRRYQVETALREGRAADGVAHLAAYPREAFPPHWSPPPTHMSMFTYVKDSKLILTVLEESTRTELPDWARDLYLRRLSWVLRAPFADYEYMQRLAEALPRIPGGMAVLEEIESDPQYENNLRGPLSTLRSLIREKSGKKAPEINEGPRDEKDRP
jgi:hypothetical protein